MAHQLTAQLMSMAALPSNLLCGHAAQIDFWADEVAHCLSLFDTYESRFAHMLHLQRAQGLEVDPLFYRPIPRPGYIPEPHRNHVRAELCRAFTHFVNNCARQAQLDKTMLSDSCQRLGINVDLAQL